MKENKYISIGIFLLVFIIIILIGWIALNNMPIQLEIGFEKYCSQNNGSVSEIFNVSCRAYHEYCYKFCSSTGLNMDDWIRNQRIRGFALNYMGIIALILSIVCLLFYLICLIYVHLRNSNWRKK